MVTASFPDNDAGRPEGNPHQWLPEPAQIVDRCARMAAAGEPDGLTDLLGQMGAPVDDMVVTPLSARAALLGARQGRAFFHHELRRRVPVPADQGPEISVWDAGTPDKSPVPTWQRGVLEEPKYFSFFQDMPFPAFNPNYRRKWRPHELIHGALRFFWHPEMTRFEMYVGSRINELLPVVHWHQFDELFRPRCPEHAARAGAGHRLYRDYCAKCEAAARPYWTSDANWRTQRRPQANTWAERGLQHFKQEWDACRAEIDTGQLHEVDHPRLDASSDAIGYMRSHWNRVTAWSFGVWVETFLSDGLDYFSSLDRYLTHLGRTTQGLLSGDIDVDAHQYTVRRGRRTVQDVAYRIYVALGWLDPGTDALQEAERGLMPQLEQAAHHVHHVLDDDQLHGYSEHVVSDLLAAFDDVRHHFPDDVAHALPALGYTWSQPTRFIQAANAQLVEGVQQALPLCADQLGDQLDATVAEFVGSEGFGALGRIAERFAAWLAAGHADSLVDHDLAARAAELADFEAWSMALPRKDRQAELFGCLPKSLDEFALRPGQTRLNETLRRRTFPAAVVARVTGDPEWSQVDEPVEMARIFMRDELRLIVVDDHAAHIFEAIADARPRRKWVAQADAESLASLLENGFVIWRPQPS